ncbi:MAG: thymidine kinase [Planctomycetes bacterium]|nr:thymidine kinase [Planctomycetota bacterium]
MHILPNGTGWIEVICGSMFSGKTEELIRRVRRAALARQTVRVFKPDTDTRYAADAVVSHDRQRLPSVAVRTARDILRRTRRDVQVVGIDEAQFFGSDLVPVCEALADRGARVIVAGLDQDYRGRPFAPMPELLAVAEFITKNLAICMRCGNPANRSYRKSATRRRIAIGAAERYEARCRRCFCRRR